MEEFVDKTIKVRWDHLKPIPGDVLDKESFQGIKREASLPKNHTYTILDQGSRENSILLGIPLVYYAMEEFVDKTIKARWDSSKTHTRGCFGQGILPRDVEGGIPSQKPHLHYSGPRF